ncbi:hypothetical protein F8M41_001156 [Gigaspora margarita]|uniref:Uncharacterized protein n=1 Tax=Gigaspora margarita TaxID=4874 RepID=A0A8H4A810_GIGMA|nr:hypothetical protein F8M41_001156 [Gigaspora margarita]
MKLGLFLFLTVFAIATLATPLSSGDSFKRQANRNMFCSMCAATCPESWSCNECKDYNNGSFTAPACTCDRCTLECSLGGWNCTSCTSCS